MGKEDLYIVQDESLAPLKTPVPKGRFSFLWNPDKKEFLGRTAGSWGKIGLFYLVFYGILSGMVTIFFYGLMATLSDDKPKYNVDDGTQSILQVPGMNCVPRDLETPGTALPEIIYKSSQMSSYDEFIKELNSNLKDYRNLVDDVHSVSDCGGSFTQSCNLSVSQLGECDGISDPTYGYKDNNPCILLKMNKVHGWRPALHDQNPNPALLNDWESTSLAVSCEEETTAFVKDMEIFPSNGFSATCFPFCGLTGSAASYKSPLVMVKLNDVPFDETITIWCRAWDASVENHHRRDRQAGVRFVVKIEK